MVFWIFQGFRHIREKEFEDKQIAKEIKKSNIMSLVSKMKPFFIEVNLVGDWGNKRGFINGALIESVEAVNNKKPEKGCKINYVFGDKQLVEETLEDVMDKMKKAIDENF